MGTTLIVTSDLVIIVEIFLNEIYRGGGGDINNSLSAVRGFK